MTNYILLSSGAEDTNTSQLSSKTSNEFILKLNSNNNEFITLFSTKLNATGLVYYINDIRGNINPTLQYDVGTNINITSGNITWNTADPYSVNFGNGSSLSIPYLLSDSAYLSTQFNESSTLSVSVQASPVAYFSADGYTGNNSYIDIQKNYLLSAEYYSGDNSNGGLDTHPSFSLGTFDSYEGSTVNSILLTYVIVSASGNDGSLLLTDLDVHPGITLNIDAYEGSNTSGILTPSIILNVSSVVDGSFIESYLTTNPEYKITFDNYDGSNVFAELSISKLLIFDFYEGSNNSSVLETFPSSHLSPGLSGIGETLDIVLITSSMIDSYHFSGENVYFDIETKPASELLLQLHEGSSLELDIQKSTFISPNFDSGDNVYFDLSYLVNTGTPIDFYHGNDLSIDQLILNSTFKINNSEGCYSDFQLATEYIFPIDKIGNSETLQADLTLSPPAEFVIDCHSGSSTSLDTSFRTRLGIFQFDGTTLLTDITLFSSSGIALEGYSGSEMSSYNPEFSTPFINSHGENLVIGDIGTEPNWYFFEGQQSSSTLRTSVIMDALCVGGDECIADLSIHPSEGLGEFNAYSGSEILAFVSTQISQHFTCIIPNDIHFQVDMDSQTYFDLISDSCCGPRPLSNHQYDIELDRGETPEIEYDGEILNVFHSELSCSKFLQVSFAVADSQMYFKDFSDYLELDFYSGESALVKSFDADLRNRLCNGYFIPSGDNVVTELTDVLDENCYVDRLYSGESLSIGALHNTVGFAFKNYFASDLKIDLTIDPPWELNIMVDVELHFPVERKSYAFMECDFLEGSNTIGTFQEPDWLGYSGEYSTCKMVTTKIVLEYDEAGCLQNDYQYLDEQGNPIEEKYMPVAIELYPFKHCLKMKPRCV